MKAVMARSILKTMLSHLSIVGVEDVDITFLESGWYISSKDANNVAIVQINIWKECMDSYEFEPYQADYSERLKQDPTDETAVAPQRASIPYRKLVESVNVIPDGQPVTVISDSSFFILESGPIHITIRQGFGFNSVEFRRIEPAFVFGIATERLEKVLPLCRDITDEVIVHVDGNGLDISVADESLTGVKYSDSEVTSEEPQEAYYPLDYLSEAFRMIKGDVLIQFQSNFPMILTTNKPFTTTFFLAPRIHEGD